MSEPAHDADGNELHPDAVADAHKHVSWLKRVLGHHKIDASAALVGWAAYITGDMQSRTKLPDIVINERDDDEPKGWA